MDTRLVKRKYYVNKTSYPIDSYGYKYNVQVLTSYNGRKTYIYCGIGRFCKTLQEALTYIENYEKEHQYV